MSEIISSADVAIISVSDLELLPEQMVGHADGEECLTTDGTPTGEKIVYETDEDGNFIGWHKEALK